MNTMIVGFCVLLSAPLCAMKQEATRPIISSRAAIEQYVDVELNGLKQKLLIQTNDLKNPILLWLHGGPGISEMLINHHCMNRLYYHFTIVHWDQRGTAMSYRDDLKAADITFTKTLDDALLLTKWLKRTYGQEKVFIIGHSFGSVLGMNLIKDHPEHYRAFIGMGQVIDDAKSQAIVRKWLAHKLKDDHDMIALKKLIKSGNIPKELVRKYQGIFYGSKSMMEVVRESPLYRDGYEELHGKSMHFVFKAMGPNPHMMGTPIFQGIRKVEVPIYFFEGRHDRIFACAPEAVVEYLPFLKAPHKEIVWFEKSAHHPNIDEPEKFQRMLIEKVWQENHPGAGISQKHLP